MKKIILASGSPRRRKLLKLAGIDFDVIISDCDENISDTSPEDVVSSLAGKKCMNVADRIMSGQVIPDHPSDEGYVVIGSDTIVVLDGAILGKPCDSSDAFRMLKSLSGKTHRVYTGVAVYDTALSDIYTFTEMTEVTMYDLSPDEINAYIATGEPMDKAGAYGIQGRGALLIKRINGDYSTVVGLPVARLCRELKRFTD